jgi:DNA repair protein RadA/Sms
MLRAHECQLDGAKYPVKRHSHYVCLACETLSSEFSLICYKCQACDTISAIDEDELDALQDDDRKPRQRAKRAILISSATPPLIPTGRKAWDIVLGGGLTRPSSVLIPGPAGVGKSTCLLSIADAIGTRLKRPVLYGSAEMPKEHLRRICDDLKLSMQFLFINDSSHAEDMHDDIAELKPVVIVWDSVQRYTVNGDLGTNVTLRNVVRGAIESGNRVKAASLLVSHVTKDDDFMGENGIGHDVDAIVHLRKVDANLIAVETREKNRFAPTPLTATEPLR